MEDGEVKVINYGFTEGVLDFDVDANKDGEPVVKISLDTNEAVQEIIRKGTSLEGVSVTAFEFDGSKLKVVIDSDTDGEPVLKIEVDLLEAFDEIKDSLV